jgi:hypothetical protein
MSENIKNIWSGFISSKAYIFVIIVAVLSAIIFFLASANQQKIASTSISITDPQTKTTLINNFAEANNLVKISDTPSISNQLYFFGNNADTKPVFISKSAKFVETGNVLQSKKLFVPDTVYDLGNNSLLINQLKESYKLDVTDGNSVLLANSIFSITPLNGKYFFIQARDGEYVIKRSNELTLSDPETILVIPQGQIGNPDLVQIRLFNDVPYLWTSNINSNGYNDVTFYRFGKTLDKKLELTNVYSEKYGYNKALFTFLDNSKISNTQLIDFTNPDRPLISYIDFRQELGQTAKGKVTAQRCAIANGENKILCMVKQDETAYFDETKKDIFVEFDIDNQSTKVLYSGFNISASSVYYSPSNQVFIIGQENGLIYRVNDK